jgi:hypothetical protein
LLEQSAYKWIEKLKKMVIKAFWARKELDARPRRQMRTIWHASVRQKSDCW